MISGKLGSAALAATTNTSIYTVPASTATTANVNMVNRTNSVISIRLSIGSSPPIDDDYIEYEADIPGYGVLERTGLAMSTAEVLVARASAVGISVRAHGFEEVA